MNEPNARGAKNSPATLETMSERFSFRHDGHTFILKPISIREWAEFISDRLPYFNNEVEDQTTKEKRNVNDNDISGFLYLEATQGKEKLDDLIANYDKWLGRKATLDGVAVSIDMLESLNMIMPVACRIIDKVKDISGFPKL